ncbi:hypothetical protein KDK95_34835, partial [Actinospica sp. MGRD01-02]
MKQGSSISAGDAERLLRGEHVDGAREQQVADVLAQLAPADAADAPVPAALLLAFARQAPGADAASHAADHAADRPSDRAAASDRAVNGSRRRRARTSRTGARSGQFSAQGRHFGVRGGQFGPRGWTFGR